MAKLRFISPAGIRLPSYFHWNDAISSFCRKEAFAFLSDRFGYLNQFSRIDAASISTFPSTSVVVDFAACMNARAIELAQLCTSRDCACHIMWSGGCDSTAVVAALFHTGFPLERLRVLYSKSSVEEFPEFYAYLRRCGISLECVPGYALFHEALRLSRRGDIVVTGFPADQLFGSILGQNYPGDTTKTHWTKWLDSDVANQQYEAAFAHYRIPVKTVAEFLWFNNFALKWDYVCHPGLMMCRDHHQNIIPFYDTRDFEEWSVSNFDILHKYDQKSPDTYKVQVKDYIYSVVAIKAVYNLRKQPSIARARTIEPSPLGVERSVAALDDDGNIFVLPVNSRRDYVSDAGLACANILRRYLKK